MQTSYTIEHSTAMAGDLAASDLGHEILAARNNAATDLPFGRAVAHDAGTGTSDLAAKLPSALSDVVFGVSVRSAARTSGPVDFSGVDGVRSNDMFDCLTQGLVVVVPEQVIVTGDDVYVRFGTGSDSTGADLRGALRKDADTLSAWAKNTVYAKGARVALADGTVLQAASLGTSDADVSLHHATGPTGTGAGISDGSVEWNYVPAWAKNTVYTKGDYVRADTDRVYQCASSGTSDNHSGTGPSGTGTAITDGTAEWNFVSVWAKNTAYTKGDYRRNSNKVYKCASSGTSANDTTATGPTGTGSAITDGAAAWDYFTADAWVKNTAYTKGDYALGSANKVYKCASSGTSANDTTAGGPTGTGSAITDGAAAWDYFTADAWTKNTSYTKGEYCTSDSSKVYKCIASGTSSADYVAPGPTGTGSSIPDGTVQWRNVAAWVKSTNYEIGQYCTNDSGKVYVCTDSGTAAGSGGPTGTDFGIADGDAEWDFVSTASAWAQNTGYALSDAASNDSGKIYLCTQAGTSAADASAIALAGIGSDIADGTVHWACMGTLVAWAQGTSYVLNNVVTNDSAKKYICVTAGVAEANTTAAAPTGTGTGITDGSATWDYMGTLAAWVQGTTYALSDVVTNDSAKKYICVTAGVAEADTVAPGPTGTGTGITDGSATWDYVGTPSAWLPSHDYALDATCSNDSGKYYVCSQAGRTDYTTLGPTTQGTGIIDGSATWNYVSTVAAWISSTHYSLANSVTNDSGKSYVCVTAGTSDVEVAAHTAGEPVGAGVDGSVTWAVAGTCDASTRASAKKIPAVWRTSAAAGVVAVVELNFP